MGYDVHITRAARWNENAGREIASDEWLALVDEDDELTLDPPNGPYAALWKAARASAGSGWFDWHDGNVYTTNPSRGAVAKMLAIAERLSALVQGDDGEVYDSERDWRVRD